MVTGAEHYLKAQEMAQLAAEADADAEHADVSMLLQFAQVHATLALAAAAALKDPDGGGFYTVDRLAWEAAASLYRPGAEDVPR